MKSKLISLILILAMTALLAASCAPATGTPPNPGDMFPEGPVGPENPGGVTGNYTFADAAELEASKVRLENADLSFNFVTTSSVNEKSKSGMTLSSLDTVTASGEGYTFTADRDMLIDGRYDYNFFAGNEDYLAEVGRNARETADWFIENIYAMDTMVVIGSYTYMMSYDKATDALSVTQITDFGEYTEYRYIKLYYDTAGNEVVEMITANSSGVYKLVYCKDVYYESTSCELYPEANYYSRQIAYRENGFWRNVAISMDSAFALFTGPDTPYVDQNAGLYVDIAYETSEGLISVRSNLEPRRADGSKVCVFDGALEILDDAKRPDDYYTYYADMLWAYNSFFNSAYDQNYAPVYAIGIDALSGWDEVIFSSELSVSEAGGYYESGFATYGESEISDIYLLSGDKKIPIRTEYTKTYGFMSFIGYDNGCEQYLLEDGVTVICEHDIPFGEYVEVMPTVEMAFDGNGEYTDEIAYVTLSFAFGDNGWYDRETGEYLFTRDEMAEIQMRAVESYLLAAGLMTEGELSYPRFLLNNFASAAELSATLFVKATGYEPTAEGFTAVFNGELERTTAFLNGGIDEIVAAYPSEEFNYDKLNAYKALGAAMIEIDGNIAGTVSVSESGIDFSALEVTLRRSTLLSVNRKYGVIVTFNAGNADATLPVYENVQFRGSDIAFRRDTSLPLPVSLTEGTYTLSLYYVRENEDGGVRISNIAPLPTSDFEEFTVEYDLDRNGEPFTYTANYKFVDGSLVLTVDIKDIEPPEIHLNGAGYNEETDTYSFRYERSKKMTVKDLLSALDVYDRVDGTITLTAENITKDASSVALSKTLLADEVYTVTVSDVRGNVATAKFKIDAYAKDESDKTPPTVTVSEELTYNALLGAYVYSFGESTPKSAVELFSLVRATDPECGTIPLTFENVSCNGTPIDSSDMLKDGATYTLVFEDFNLNRTTVKVYIEIYSEF